MKNLIELFLIPHPAIIRFALPEGLAAPTQYPIGLAGAGALKGAHDFRWLLMGLQQQMDVVRHDYPGVKIE